MKKKFTINAILNVIKSVLALLFPLITFPYVSRVLGVDNIGKINFSSSIITYIALIAGLGISTYGIREVAKRRKEQDKLDEFTSQLYSFNIITAIISYVILAILIIASTTLKQYSLLIGIYSIQIILNTLGTDWINVAFEEFKYITIRYIVFQILSIVLMFLFVHTKEDYIIYAITYVISVSGANLLNYFYVRKFCNIKFTLNIPWKTFLVPTLLIFISSLATAIFTNIDVTMLGYIKGDYSVGIYSCALKIYKMLQQIIIAIIFVFEPRLSYEIGKNKDQYIKIANSLLCLLLTITIPIAVGVILVSNDAIILFAGEEFAESVMILKILSFSVILSSISYYIIHVIMLPDGMEKKIGIPSIVGAIVDVIANFILIPNYGLMGAAVATLIAEFSVLFTSIILGKIHKYVKVPYKDILKIMIGTMAMTLVSIITLSLDNSIMRIILTVIVCSLTYFIIELVLKNNFVYEYCSLIINKLFMKKKISPIKDEGK